MVIRRCSCILRTIPTRVGRTRMLYFAHGFLADHPHTRGENFKPVD